VSLLNFQEFEKKIFNAQLAFNILSEPEAAARTEARVIEQLDEILGKTFPKTVITAVQAPVFHSYAFSMFLQLGEAPAAEQVSAYLRSNPRFSTDAPIGGPSPVSVVGTDKIHVGRVHRVNQDNTYALWVVADNLRLAASNAIETADLIMLAQALEA
jgi:aspartate-semialdehyde dehydrogenase